MIVVKKGYYYINEVMNYCYEYKKYSYFINILKHLKEREEKYVSSNFFYNELYSIKHHLTDLTNYFHIKYFNLNPNQEKKLLEYFDYKKPRFCKTQTAIHIYNEEVVNFLKNEYIINFLGFYKNIEKLREKGIMILNYNKIIILENKKSNKKLFLGAYK